jgi:hypothetical protein
VAFVRFLPPSDTRLLGDSPRFQATSLPSLLLLATSLLSNPGGCRGLGDMEGGLVVVACGWRGGECEGDVPVPDRGECVGMWCECGVRKRVCDVGYSPVRGGSPETICKWSPSTPKTCVCKQSPPTLIGWAK